MYSFRRKTSKKVFIFILKIKEAFSKLAKTREDILTKEKKRIERCLTYGIVILILFEPLPSYAYLDPGTGSMLVSAMVGVVATLFFFIKGVYYSGIGFFYTLLGKRTKKTKMSIVFYSEGKQYWFTFKPVIDALSKAGKTCTYLTSDEKDPGLTYLSAGLTAKYIGTGNKAFSVLNMLEADLCAMTTLNFLPITDFNRRKAVFYWYFKALEQQKLFQMW